MIRNPEQRTPPLRFTHLLNHVQRFGVGKRTAIALLRIEQAVILVEHIHKLAMQEVATAPSRADGLREVRSTHRVAGCDNFENVWQPQQFEVESLRLRSELTKCQALLEAETSKRHSSEQLIMEQLRTIEALSQQLCVGRDTIRDLSCSTARLSEAIWDLADADDAEGEAQRIQVRYDEQERKCARMTRIIADMENTKAQLEGEIEQWADKHARLCAESNRRIVQKDEEIYWLRTQLGQNMPDPRTLEPLRFRPSMETVEEDCRVKNISLSVSL